MKPGRTLRCVFQAPVYLYHWNGGWLLGHRFLLLTHIGHRSGRQRETVLEVLEYRADGPELIVMSGFGTGADWFRNIKAAPEPEIHIGRQHFVAVYRILPAHEAALVIKGYERRNRRLAPIVRAVLRRLLGWRYTGTDDDRRRLVAQLPIIAFRPHAERSRDLHRAMGKTRALQRNAQSRLRQRRASTADDDPT